MHVARIGIRSVFIVLVGKLERKMPFGRPKRRWEPIAVPARSKAWVYGRLLAGIVGSNPARIMNVCLL